MGDTKGFKVVLTQELEVLPILIGGGGRTKYFHPLKGVASTVLPCLGGGGQTIFQFFSPPHN